jgi:hypothetical protein
MTLVRPRDVSYDIGDRADAMEVIRAWIVDFGMPLQQDSNRALIA